jgi:hypothetical protein
MKDLYFQRPTFRKGLNITVRNGDKWFKAVAPGDMVRLVEADADVIMGADVLFTDYLPPREIPALWLKFEHDPSCRDLAGLEAELVRVYGDEPITSKVTVIGFLTTQAYSPEPTPEPAPTPEED